jgi:hypothetical protein
MMGFSDLPDPEKGRKIFEDAYGATTGLRRFRTLLRILIPLAVFAVVVGLAVADWHLVKTASSEVMSWFSTTKPIQVQPPSAGCNITGGTNYGEVNQTCR